MTTIGSHGHNPCRRLGGTHGSSQGGCLSEEQAQQLAVELDRLCRPDRLGLGSEVIAGLRVEVVGRWQEYAACAGADPEAWFPDTTGSPVPSAVVRTCAQCPVRRSCLATAVLWAVDGVWAGTTTADRSKTAQRLRAGAPIADVLTSTLEQAKSRIGHRSQYSRHRDWFHAPARTDDGTVPSERGGKGEPGAAA